MAWLPVCHCPAHKQCLLASLLRSIKCQDSTVRSCVQHRPGFSVSTWVMGAGGSVLSSPCHFMPLTCTGCRCEFITPQAAARGLLGMQCLHTPHYLPLSQSVGGNRQVSMSCTHLSDGCWRLRAQQHQHGCHHHLVSHGVQEGPESGRNLKLRGWTHSQAGRQVGRCCMLRVPCMDCLHEWQCTAPVRLQAASMLLAMQSDTRHRGCQGP